MLTYDDAMDIDIDNIAPTLDSLNLKATFYIIGSSPSLAKRLDEWRLIAQHGHELGNHGLVHPCDARVPGRNFVGPDNDLSKYTVSRAVTEIRINNVLLKAIDGKNNRTYAYPCGDKKIGDSLFYNGLKKDLLAARGIDGVMRTINNVQLDNMPAYIMNGNSAESMIALVNEAIETHSLLVFLFHGVGSQPLKVSLAEHSKLLHYLKQNQDKIWIAPMVDVAEYIQTTRSK